MVSFAPEVLIIGAGAAGLAAAKKLSNAGIFVTVIEARDRIGGRILTVHPAGLGVAVELGAEFIHGHSRETFALIEKAGLEVEDVSGELFCSNEQAIGRCDFWGRIEKVLEAMKKRASPQQSFDSFVRELHDAEISEEDKRAACGYVRGFHAAHPEEISVQSLIEGMEAEEKIDGHRSFRLPAGYDQLADALQKQHNQKRRLILTKTLVAAVRWKTGTVEVDVIGADGSKQTLSAPRLLSTLPLGQLTAAGSGTGIVNFDPPLRAKQDAFAKLRVGHVIRVTMVFRRRFWEELKADGRSLAKMSFLFSHDATFPTFWTLMPMEFPVLTAWAPADAAERLSKLSDSEICDQAVQALVRVLHIPAQRCRTEMVQAYTHNWQNDPFSRGAYSYVAAGGSDVQRQFAAPLENTLFFAGEATNFDGHHGTVHGAIASGYRAADEILKSKDNSKSKS